MQENKPVSNPNQQFFDTQPISTPISQQLDGVFPPTQRLVQKEKSNRGLIVVLMFFALVVLGITGAIAYQTYQLRKQAEKATPGLKITPTKTPPPTLTSTISAPSPTPTVNPTVNFKTYSNEKYGFSFNYPQSWQINDVQGPGGLGISLSNIANGHTISIHVWRVTGFGYCYKYGEIKNVIVGGKNAETADGIGGTEMCDKPEEFSNRGNTYVLIPIDDTNITIPRNQIHISYDYPLDDINLAKINLDRILSTFKFTH